MELPIIEMTLDATNEPEESSIDAKLNNLKTDTEQIINDGSTDKNGNI